MMETRDLVNSSGVKIVSLGLRLRVLLRARQCGTSGSSAGMADGKGVTRMYKVISMALLFGIANVGEDLGWW